MILCLVRAHGQVATRANRLQMDEGTLLRADDVPGTFLEDQSPQAAALACPFQRGSGERLARLAGGLGGPAF